MMKKMNRLSEDLISGLSLGPINESTQRNLTDDFPLHFVKLQYFGLSLGSSSVDPGD